MPYRWSIVVLILALTCLAGCPPKPIDIVNKPVDFYGELAPGEMALRKISPEQYPNFEITARMIPSLKLAADRSVDYLNKPSSKKSFGTYLDITHERALATVVAFRAFLDDPSAPATINQFVREKCEVYQSKGAPDPNSAGGYTNRVLFTGYCTPIYEASLTRTGPFQFPLYKRPADLPAPNIQPTGEVVTTKYLPREKIESSPSPLAGQELVWLKTRWEAYVINVQGSGRLKLTEGKIMEVGYAGNNGYDYVSIRQKMFADGLITKEQFSLKAMTDYFAKNPAAMDKYLNMNPRYVFFADRPGGPFGCLNEPVTPFATIATDKAVYPRAMPAFLMVPIPTNEGGATLPFRGFMMDQDAGGAIRAAGRTDIYMGIGDYAQSLAGHQMHEGSLYYIALKPNLVSTRGK